MIVKLTYTNDLPVAVELLNNQGTGQPLVAGQSLEMTFALEPDADGVADIVLICRPS